MIFSYDTSHPAVVLSLFDTGLITARCLSADGIKVTGLGYRPEEIGRCSLSLKTVNCPHPITKQEELLRLLLDVSSKSSQKPVLYPASDLFVSFLNNYRNELAKDYLFVIPPKETTRILTSKTPQYEACDKLGIPQSRAVFPKPGDNIPHLARDLKFPVFIKPVSNYPWQDHFFQKGFVCQTIESLERMLSLILEKNLSVMVQEIIPGGSTSNFEVSMYIDKNGRRRAHLTVQKIHQYPAGFGLATRIVSVSNPQVEALAFSAAEKLGILGFANMEFKYDSRDGAHKYIETNVRVWQQIDLGRVCGVPFTALHHADATGQTLPEKLLPTVGKVWVDPVIDFYASAGLPDFSFWTWFRETLGADVKCVLKASDPIPTIKKLGGGLEPLRMMKFAFKTRQHKQLT